MRKPTSYFNDTFNYKPGQYEKIFGKKQNTQLDKDKKKDTQGSKKKWKSKPP